MDIMHCITIKQVQGIAGMRVLHLSYTQGSGLVAHVQAFARYRSALSCCAAADRLCISALKRPLRVPDTRFRVNYQRSNIINSPTPAERVCARCKLSPIGTGTPVFRDAALDGFLEEAG